LQQKNIGWAFIPQQIRQWFEPPQFPDNEEKNQQARLMNTTGLYYLMALALAGLVYVPFFAQHKAASWAAILILFILYLIARIFLFRGRLTFAGSFLVISGWLVGEAGILIGGGLSSPMMFALTAVTIAVGLLFKQRIGQVVMFSSILAGLIFAVLQQYAVTLPQVYSYSPLAVWFYFTLSLIFINWTMNLTVQELRGALTQAQHQNAAREKAETTLRESESKYRQLYESMSDGFGYADMEGRILEYNETFRQMLGYDNGQLEKLSYLELTPRQWHEAEQKIIQEQVLLLGYSHVYEKEYRRKDGTVFPIELRTSLVVDEKGQPRGMAAIVRDITLRKRSEEELRETQMRFSTVFHSSPVGIAISRLDGVLTDVNPALCELLGYTREEIMNEPLLDFDLWARADQREQMVKTLRLEGNIRNFEVQLLAKTGGILDAIMNAEPIELNGEKYILSLLLDITERKQAEMALQTSQEDIHAILTAIPDLMFEVDQDGRFFTFHSPTGAPLFLPENSLIGKTVRDVMPPAAAGVILYAIDDAGKQGSHHGAMYALDLPAGRRWYELSIQAKHSGHRAVKRFIVLARDVTDRKQVEESEREQRAFAEALGKSASALNSTLNFQEVLDRVLDNVGQVVPHDTANIMLLDPDGKTLTIACHRGYAVDVGATSLSLAAIPALTQASRTGQTLVIPDTQATPFWISLPDTEWIRSFLSAPIQIRKRTVGFLNLDSATPGFFTFTHAERLQSFANQAAIAIENAQLYEEVQKLAVTDSLTGSFNRTFFETELARLELGREFPVSIVVADLDNMKHTNDTLGHAAGDTLLKRTQQILQAAFRAVDIIARIGGDEFAVLLPATDAVTVVKMISRVHLKLAENNAQHPDLPIHLSLGTYTAQQGRLSEAFIVADQRMYASKAERKQRMNR
jgi:diguanylate cyclase (GGDEF)-like protein/PAS domain S-box-containing protein